MVLAPRVSTGWEVNFRSMYPKMLKFQLLNENPMNKTGCMADLIDLGQASSAL